MSFSPDGKQVVGTSSGRVSCVWDVATGTRLAVLFTGRVDSATFSPNGKMVITVKRNQRNGVLVWDAITGEKLGSLDKFGPIKEEFEVEFQFGISAARYSPDGKRFTVNDYEGRKAVVYDAVTGTKLCALTWLNDRLRFTQLSPDGTHAIRVGDTTAAVWDVTTGEKRYNLTGYTNTVKAVQFSPEDVWLITPGYKKSLRGRPEGPSTLKGNLHRVTSASFSPDGKRILTAGNSEAIIWDAATGKEIHTLNFRTNRNRFGDAITCASFSPDGKRVATASCDEKAEDNTVELWDAHTGKNLNTVTEFPITEFRGRIRSASFSPSGKKIVFIRDGLASALEWHTDMGKVGVRMLKELDRYSYGLMYSPGENEKVITIERTTATIRDDNIYKGRYTLSHVAEVISASFSPDGERVATASSDRTAVVWDTATGKKLGTLAGHTSVVTSVSFSPDGKRVVTASEDGTTRLWEADSGRELVCLVSLDAGKDWLVVTPEGLFDGSAGGRQKVAFRVDGKLDVVPVDRFFRDFYYPGLLAEIMAGKRPLPGKSITANNPAPSVKILVHPAAGGAAPNQVAVDVAVTDAGGGMSGPYLQHNGAAVRAGKLLQQDGKTKTYRFTLDLVTGENNFEARAATADRIRESDPAGTVVPFEGKLPEPDLYVLAVGINKHIAGAGFTDLNFSVPDAKAVAELFRQRAGALYKNVHVTLLLDEQATREGILKAVEEIAKKARSQDTLVMYQSGHGMAVGQRFYLIPHDYKKTNASAVAAPIQSTANVVATRGYKSVEGAETAIPGQGLAADVLGDALSAVPALRRVLIFDTCYSGGAAKLADKGHNPFAARGAVARGAVERFARSQGVYLLTAVAANDEASEIEDLGHGILTYSLLAGTGRAAGGPLQAKGLPADRTVDVLAWFGYARSNVPGLCQTYVGREQHVEIAGSDQPSFPLLTPSK